VTASLTGIKLKPDTLCVLSLDGTLVYVEEVTAQWIRVIALPDQDETRADEQILVAGRVGGKKISPYAAKDYDVEPAQLSERNQRFLQFFRSWRDEHGPGYVDMTDEQRARITEGKKVVIKAPTKKEQRAAAREARGPRERKSKAAAAPDAFTLAHEDLSTAIAADDRYAEPNRGWRVFAALRSLPDRTGAVPDIIAALVQDGRTPLSDPDKVVRRALKQLSSTEYGGVVAPAGAAASPAI